MNQFTEDTLKMINKIKSLINSANNTNAQACLATIEQKNVVFEALSLYEAVLDQLPGGIVGQGRKNE